MGSAVAIWRPPGVGTFTDACILLRCPLGDMHIWFTAFALTPTTARTRSRSPTGRPTLSTTWAVILVGGLETTSYMASSAPTATLMLWRGRRTPSAESERDPHAHLAAVYVRGELAAGRLRGFRALIPFRLVEQREGETYRVKPSSEPRPNRNSAHLQVKSKRHQTKRKGR
jgi:hypothetical protein